MTNYIYHTSDLKSGAPQVLPAPLVAGALFFSGGSRLTGDIETFLIKSRVDTANVGNIWLVIVWDASSDSAEIAKAAFTWTGTSVELLGITVGTTHPAIPIRRYLMQTGSGLFEGRPIVEPATREQRTDISVSPSCESNKTALDDE